MPDQTLYDPILLIEQIDEYLTQIHNERCDPNMVAACVVSAQVRIEWLTRSVRALLHKTDFVVPPTDK